MSLVKVPYQLLVGLLAAAPWSAADSRPLRRWGCLLAIVMAVGFGGWSLLIAPTLSPFNPAWKPGEHLEYVLSHPDALLWGTFGYLRPDLFWRTLKQFVGVLGALDSAFPNWFYPLHVLSLVLVTALEPIRPGLLNLRRLKLGAGLVGLAGCWIVCFVVLVAGTEIGSSQMFVQGRYFIPFAPLLLLPLAGATAAIPWIERWRPWLRSVWAVYLSLSLGFMIWTLRCRYYE